MNTETIFKISASRAASYYKPIMFSDNKTLGLGKLLENEVFNTYNLLLEILSCEKLVEMPDGSVVSVDFNFLNNFFSSDFVPENAGNSNIGYLFNGYKINNPEIFFSFKFSLYLYSKGIKPYMSATMFKYITGKRKYKVYGKPDISYRGVIYEYTIGNKMEDVEYKRIQCGIFGNIFKVNNITLFYDILKDTKILEIKSYDDIELLELLDGIPDNFFDIIEEQNENIFE